MEGTNTLEDNLRSYSEYVCQNLSCHGGNWASKIRSGKLKTFYLIVLLGIQCIVFQYIISNLAAFISGDRHLSTSYFKAREFPVPYPKITVCNPRMFDARLVEKFNISSELLAYIRFTVDQEAVATFMRYGNTLDEAPVQEFIHKNITSDILSKIAIRCNDFIIFCDVFYHRNCCGDVFNPKPTFSSDGTCFTTNPISSKLLSESESTMLLRSNIIALNVAKSFTKKGYNITSSGAIRSFSGAKIAFHYQDLGLNAIEYQDQHMEPKNFYKFRIQMHKEDRLETKGLKNDFAENENRECATNDEISALFLNSLGYTPWSEINCKQFFLDHLHNVNCSLAITKGFEPLDEIEDNDLANFSEMVFKDVLNMTNTKEICTPVHMQESYANYTTDPSYFTKRSEVLYYLIDKACRPNCNEIKYDVKRTRSPLEKSEETRENIFIKVVLSSLSVTTFKIAPKDYEAYLSDLGGFMGMIMGASWISIIELAIFYVWWIYIIFIFCCKKIKDGLGL